MHIADHNNETMTLDYNCVILKLLGLFIVQNILNYVGNHIRFITCTIQFVNLFCYFGVWNDFNLFKDLKEIHYLKEFLIDNKNLNVLEKLEWIQMQ